VPRLGLPGDASSLWPFTPSLSDWIASYSTQVGFSFRLPEGSLHEFVEETKGLSVVFDYSMGHIVFGSALSMKRYTFLVLGVEDGHNALVYR
jgi:hypothetical protein